MSVYVLTGTYWDLHKWSIENYTTFLEELWQFFHIIHSEPYKEVYIIHYFPVFISRSKNACHSGLVYYNQLIMTRDDIRFFNNQISDEKNLEVRQANFLKNYLSFLFLGVYYKSIFR